MMTKTRRKTKDIEVFKTLEIIGEYTNSTSFYNENKECFFIVYKRVINYIVDIIQEVNPQYPYSKSLASSIVEGSLHQHFLKNHLKTITNLSEKECAVDFYTDMAKKILL